MMDKWETKRRLALFFRHGAMFRDGKEVGYWYVRHRPSGGLPKLGRIWRGSDGRMHGGTHDVVEGRESDIRDHDRRDAFGIEILRLMQDTGNLHCSSGVVNYRFAQGVADPGLLAAMMSEVMTLHPGISLGDARAAAYWCAEQGEGALRFLRTLDPVGLALVSRHPRHAEALGRLWHDIDPGVGDAVLAKALSAHPGFPGQVLVVHAEVGCEGLRDLMARGRLGASVVDKLVDEGVPRSLIPVAARAERSLLGLADAVLAHGSGPGQQADHDMFAAPHHPWPVEIVIQLIGLPGGWVPRDDAEWVALASLSPVIKALRRFVDPISMPRVLDAGQGWERTLRRCMAAACGTDDESDPTVILSALHDTDDMVSAYVDEALRPAWSATVDPEHMGEPYKDDFLAMARSMLFGGRSLVKALELSADWHRRQHAMRAAIAVMDGSYTPSSEWVPGLPDAVYNGVEIVVLRDARSLAASASPMPDGDGVPGLDNCAAGYTADCIAGEVRLLELRLRDVDGNLRRLSMAEIDVSRPPAFTVIQHSGRRNGAVPRDAADALKAYLDDVRKGRIPVDLGGFAPVEADKVKPVIVACGFDPTIEATRLAAAGLWDRYLPRSWRGIDPAHVIRIPMPGGGGWTVASPMPPEDRSLDIPRSFGIA